MLPQRFLQWESFGITAFRQQLAGLCFVCCLQQPFLFFRGQQAVFHGVQPGGDRQIIGILDGGHRSPSLLYGKEDRSDLFLQLFPLQPHQGIKGTVQLYITVAEDKSARNRTGLGTKGQLSRFTCFA